MIKKELVKGQSIIEFIVLIGAMLFFFTLILLAVNQKVDEKRYEDEDSKIRQIAILIQSELALARGATDGYYRTFYIPEKINGFDYILTHDIDGNRISIKTERISASYEIANSLGTLKKGENNITKINGITYVNP